MQNILKIQWEYKDGVELVFIGQFGNDDGKSRKALEEVLDSCLLTDDEMKEYETVSAGGDAALRAHFFPQK